MTYFSVFTCVVIFAGGTIVGTLTKPTPAEWINNSRHPNDKLNLISWLVDGCFYYPSGATSIPKCNFTSSKGVEEHPAEFQSFDGFSNNIFNNQLGAVDTPLLRRVPPVYNDGTYEPVKGTRINPFEASEKLMARRPVCNHDGVDGGEEACGSKTGKSAFLVFFGQQVVEEILDAQRAGCPPEYFNIPIPDELNLTKPPGKSSMPFLRSRYSQATGRSPGNPRQQLNEITPWIDGGLIYGTAKGWADVLRTFPNGTLHPTGQLASDNDNGIFPVRNNIRLPMANPPPPARHADWVKNHKAANVDRFYVLGNPRGNENAFLLSFGVVLFRWHNQFAAYLHQTRPSWSGERVFHEARKWAIGTYQQIVIYDWLPHWLGEPLEDYKAYDPSVDPQIEQFFQTAAMRFGHTLVTPGAYLRDYTCTGCKAVPFHGLNASTSHNNNTPISQGAVRTCNIYWRPQEPLEMKLPSDACLNFTGTATDNISDIDRLLMGMASQRAEREDNMIVEDLRGSVFGPLEFSRRDLMAINIQRGRDHGTPDYNTAREAFGLVRISSVDEYMNLTETHTPREIVETMVRIHTPENGAEAEAWANIDVWTGGILETSTRPGPLFRAIIKDQFNRIRNADRFWFENTRWKTPRFSDDQISRIKSLTVFDMVVSVTRMLKEDIQENPFRVPKNDSDLLMSNCRQNANWDCSLCYNIAYDSNGAIISNDTETCCQFPQLDSKQNYVENCTAPGTYDYFSGSEVSFILTYILLGLFIIGVASALKLIVFRIKKLKVEPVETERSRLTLSFNSKGIQLTAGAPPLAAREWLGPTQGTRAVIVLVNDQKLEVRLPSSEVVRSFNIEFIDSLTLVTGGQHLIIKNQKDYDLVLEFDELKKLTSFVAILKNKFTEMNKPNTLIGPMSFKKASKGVITKAHRVANLEKFFRLVFDASENQDEITNSQKFDGVLDLELTKFEFAEALCMSPSSLFVESMFNVVDLDRSGTVSFLEFFTMLVIFKKGSPEDKCRYLFKMYDTDGDGALSRTELKNMIQSLVEAASTADSKLENSRLVSQIVGTMSFGPNEDSINFLDFARVFLPHVSTLGCAELNFTGVNRIAEPEEQSNERKSYFQTSVTRVASLYGDPRPGPETRSKPNPDVGNHAQTDPLLDRKVANKTQMYLNRILVWFEVNRLNIFWTTLYTSIVLAIFAERAYTYSVEREHGGLRRIAGYGVTVTRGAASVQMFCYASLLLTMCRNMITHLRETFLNRFIPFDEFIAMHKYIACLALIFTVIHVVGHGINFYHISTQTPEDVSCLFRDYFRPSHIIPKFHYWAFQTVTGLSGILLVMLAAVIYIFATTYARTNAFKLFWITHSLYPLWYALILLHGSGRLVQSPLFFNFLIGPLVIFTVDKLITTSRQSIEIPVIEAELLPSNVTKLKFARPTGFEFKSGQWIRFACTALNSNEFHPFTISSSPHDPFLTVHIRAVGPFTNNIRRIYESKMPKIHIDGPYGEGHQDWPRYEISVLIGGGIGVTPFASILKDVAAIANPRQCKKIYFLWVTRTQRQFEWLVDIIREVESHPIISAHVFVTQSYNKFDLRTVFLYACERNFHKINQRSLFTGLRSTTHFGRPDFLTFLRGLKQNHPRVSKVGVFSCGPPPMTKNVDDACQLINSERGSDEVFEFQHRSENF